MPTALLARAWPCRRPCLLGRGAAGIADNVISEKVSRQARKAARQAAQRAHLVHGQLQAARQARTSVRRGAWATAGLPLPAFVDARYAAPEPRVSASLLGSAIDVVGLRRDLEARGCPTALWQGQVLLCGSCEAFGQQLCSAVFLPDGCVVCWHMSG